MLGALAAGQAAVALVLTSSILFRRFIGGSLLPRLLHYAAPWVVFISLVIWKNPRPFFEPRFWAEEGTDYFGPLRDAGFGEALAYTFHSNYQLLVNVLTKAASFAPLSTAPFVTTYAALLITGLLPLLTARIIRQIGGGAVLSCVAAAVLAVLPMTFEIYGSTTNIQWICGASIFLLLFVRIDGRVLAAAALIWAVVCGLSGLPSVILFPAFFVVALVTRSKAHMFIGIALLACAVFQASLVMQGTDQTREFILAPTPLLFPSILQSIYGFWLTPEVTLGIGRSLEKGAYQNSIPLLATAIAVVASIVLSARENHRYAAAFAILVGFCAAFVQTFGSLGSPFDFLGGNAGGRYYFVSSVSLIVALLLASKDRPMVVGAVLAVAVISHVVSAQFGEWGKFRDGPSWRDQVAECEGPCRIEVWPPAFVVELPRGVRNFKHYLAALAIEMGVDDAAVVGKAYPFDNTVLADFARTVAARDLSVFGLPMLRDAGLQLGEPAEGRGTGACKGWVDRVARLDPDTDFVRIDGWIIAPELGNSIDILRIIAGNGEIAGFAVYGAARPDVAKTMGVRKPRTGFSGYVRADRLGGRISISARKGGCEADMTASLTAVQGAVGNP